jgi:hypothetical protein
VPEGLLLDDNAKPITRVELAPTDVAATLLALALCAMELNSHHGSYTLNNLVRVCSRAGGGGPVSQQQQLYWHTPAAGRAREAGGVTCRSSLHGPLPRLQIACLVATDILQLVGLRSFRAATVLLVGLLAYDVFWCAPGLRLPCTCTCLA